MYNVFGMDNVAMRQKGKKGNKSSLIKEPILFGASFFKFMSCSVNNVIFLLCRTEIYSNGN